MAWSFVGVSAAVTVTGTPLTLTEPAGVADGDLLIACIASRTTSTTSIVNTGWTMVNEQKTNNTATNTSAIASGIMLYQIRSGTPDLTFTLPAAGTSVCFGRMVAYRGNATSTPVDANTAVTTATNTTAVSVAGLTTTALNDLIVAMCAGGQEAAWSAFANVGAATWNSADKDATVTLSNSNRTATSSAAADTVRTTTQRTNGAAGKYYTEFLMGTVSGGTNVGINAAVGSRNNTSTCCIRASSDGSIYVNDASSGGIGSTYTAADVICMAWDAGAERVWFRKNGGNWNNDASANPATGTNGIDVSALPNVACCAWFLSGVSGEASTIRAVSADFTQAVPSGFSEWSANLGPLTASGATDTSTAPSTTAWIERADSNTTTGADTSLAIFDAIRTGTGATGNLTATASLGAGHVVIAGAFRLKEQAGAGAAAGTTTATADGNALATADGAAVGTSTAAAASLVPAEADAWNANDVSANVTLSASDKTATWAASGSVRSTQSRPNGTAAKYYFEFLANQTQSGMKLGLQDLTTSLTGTTGAITYQVSDGSIRVLGTSVGSIAAAWSSGDRICMAWDAGAELIWVRKNPGGNWNDSGSADPATGVGGLDASAVTSVNLAMWAYATVNTTQVTIRTELAEYTETVPSGFYSWMGESLTADAWSSVDKSANITLSASDKTATVTDDSGSYGVHSTTKRLNGAAGKYYAEFHIPPGATFDYVGIQYDTTNFILAADSSYVDGTGSISINGSIVGSFATGPVSNDVICIAWDAGAEIIWFRVNNGDWNDSGTANPATNSGGLDASAANAVNHALWFNGSTLNSVATIRTEIAEFTQTVPTNFTSWMGEVNPIADAVGVAAGTSTVAATGAAAISDAWNYATASGVTLSNSDRTATATGASVAYATTINTNEARYVEITSGSSLGLSLVNLTDSIGDYGANYDGVSGEIYTDFVSDVIPVCGADDTLCIAFDLANNEIWFRVNDGDWNGSDTANPTTNSGGLATGDADNWTLRVTSDNAGRVWTLNAAADDFVYSPPSGFKSWIGETLVIDNVGAATGTGTATAAGDALKLADALAAGTSAVAALAISEITGTAAASGVATGAGDALILAAGTGAGSTVALADGWSSIFVEAVGTATGTGSTAAAYDRGTPPDDAWDWTTAVPPTMTFSNGDRTVSA